MWGVIWGHSITALLNGETNHNSIHLILRTYDMPFFMLISGYFFAFSFNKYTFKKLILNKVTTILFPTILWSLISSNFHSIYGYYFLYAVFFSSIIMTIIEKLVPYHKLKYILLITVITTLHMQPSDLWNLPYLFPYFVLGYYGVIIIKRFNLAAALTAFTICLCFWNSTYSIWKAGADLLHYTPPERLLGIITFRTIIALSGIIVVKELFGMLYDYLEKENHLFLEFIQSCGKQTLALYILQHIVVFSILKRVVHKICSHFDFNLFNLNEPLLGYVLAPWISLIIMWILLVFISWTKNTNIQKNFGDSNCNTQLEK